jgi:hypothetical protein
MKKKIGLTSPVKRAGRSAEVRPAPPLIVGFDCEWKTEGDGNLVLSYQVACRYGDVEWTRIYYTRTAERIRHPNAGEEWILSNSRDRYKFAVVIAAAISAGIREGLIRTWPKAVIACAHWSRADLSAMEDFREIKRCFDGVQRTYTTVGKPYIARVCVGGHTRVLAVVLVDTQLLAPGTSKSLAALGRLYDFPKLDVGDYILKMDQLLADDPQLYEEYAIRDAQISARHVAEMLRFVAKELGLSMKVPVTLGSIAVRYLLEVWKLNCIDANAVNGIEVVEARRYDPSVKRYMTSSNKQRIKGFRLNEELVSACFHGGRNECFVYGPTREAEYREYDLHSAYTTALAAIGIPDYEAACPSADPPEFTADIMGFARVRFRFPPGASYPSLPVVASGDRGLVFPTAGEAFVTAPEIATARHLGAKIEIIHGVIIPWSESGVRPFEIAIKDLLQRRGEHPKGSLQNEMFKQLGNSLYGKTCQGLAGIRVFDTREEEYEEIGASRITNAYIASHVTGLVRAAIGEMIAGLRRVVSVTTDAFITDAMIEDIDMSGPACRALAEARQRLTGSDGLIEAKYGARQLLPWRTRGIATLKPHPNFQPKLARGGMREPNVCEDPNGWFVRAMLLRKLGDRWSLPEPPPFRTTHLNNADFVFRERDRTANFEFDFKRRPADPRPAYVAIDENHLAQHVAFDTKPWASVEQFDRVRDTFERWRKQLQYISNWQEFQAYEAGSQASRAGVRRSSKGPVEQARKIFLRAYVAGVWGLPGGNYREAGLRLSKGGYPTTEKDFKNARRGMQNLPEGVIPRDAPGIAEFVEALLTLWPGFRAKFLSAGAEIIEFAEAHEGQRRRR